MRGLVKAVLVGAAAILLYNAYLRYGYSFGNHSEKGIIEILEAADQENAANGAKLRQQVQKAMERGDMEEVSRLLKPVAQRIGMLRDLQRELNLLAAGKQAVAPAARPTATPPPRLAEPAPRAEAAVESAGYAAADPPSPAKPAEPPRPLPLPSWDVAAPVNLAGWYGTIPGWAGNRDGIYVNHAAGLLLGGKGSDPPLHGPRTIPYGAFTSSDPEERQLARMLLTEKIQYAYRLKFGAIESPIEGAPSLPEFARSWVKNQYDEQAAVILESK
jgi:hypothetical protein